MKKYTPVEGALTLEMFEKIVRTVNEDFPEIDYCDRLYKIQSPAMQKQIDDFIKEQFESDKPISYGNFNSSGPNILTP